MNTNEIPAGRITHWWRLLFKAGATAVRSPFCKILQGHEPLVIACEREAPVIKARILSRLLSRRIDVCRRELLSEPAELSARIVPMPGITEPHNTNTMKEPDTLPVIEPQPQPEYSPKPESADAPFWLDDTDPSPSPSPSPNPGP